jgi:hypothetical protein
LGALGLRLDASPLPASDSKTYFIENGLFARGYLAKLVDHAERLGVSGADDDVLVELRQKGLLPTTNVSDFGSQRFQSDTGEILLQAKERRFSVDTSRTDVLVLADGTGRSGALTVRDPTAPVLVAVSSLDSAPVETSRHMLVFVVTDAQNSGMEFADASRTTLLRLGQLPVQLQRVPVGVDVLNMANGPAQIYSLSLSGERRDEVALTDTGAGLNFTVDTGALPGGPSTMFEVIRQ